MSANLIDNSKTSVLDLFAAKPAVQSRRASPETDKGSQRQRGFEDALREARPRGADASEPRSTSAQQSEAERDTQHASEATSENDAAEEPTRREADHGASADRDSPDAKPESQGNESANQEVSTNDEFETDSVELVALETQSAQSLASELALDRSPDAVAAAEKVAEQHATSVSGASNKQIQQALTQSAADASSQAKAQAASTATQAAAATQAQPILDDAMQQNAEGDTRGESKASTKTVLVPTQAATNSTTAAAFALPDQASGEAKLPIASANTSASVDAAKALQAQSTGLADDADADGLNASRLKRGLANAVQQRGGVVTLRLTPPEMGTVRIQMQLTGTQVSATFHAESPSAQSLLTQQLAQLRTSLESQGMSVERLSVQPLASTSSSQNASQNQNSNDSQQQSQAQQQAGGDGRSRGQYSGDSPDRNGSNADDPSSKSPRQRTGFFEQLNSVEVEND